MHDSLAAASSSFLCCGHIPNNVHKLIIIIIVWSMVDVDAEHGLFQTPNNNQMERCTRPSLDDESHDERQYSKYPITKHRMKIML